MRVRARRSTGPRQHRLPGDRRGVAMVEFALILPVLLLLYVGSIELTGALSCQRKLGATSRFVADAASQSIVLEAAQVDDIAAASRLIMTPYPAAGLTIRVSAVQTAENGATSIVWSKAYNGSAATKGDTLVLPPDLVERGRFLIHVETLYDLRKSSPFGLYPTIRLADDLYMAPRQSRTISCRQCS